MSRHELTTDERRRGATKSAEVKREKREESRRLAADRLFGLVSRAIDELEQLINDEDSRVRLRAAQQILDRTLGKSNQPIDVATVHHDVELENAREELTQRLNEIGARRTAAAEPINHRGSVNIADVVRVAIDAGVDLDSALRSGRGRDGT